MSSNIYEYILNIKDNASSILEKIGLKTNNLHDKLLRTQLSIKDIGLKFVAWNQASEIISKANDSLAQLARPGIEFQQSLADLSAITGIAGEQLNELSKSARQIGIESGLGASQAVEAFKLLASNIEISKIGIEGLKELQKQTIVLSQAAGIDLPTAANTMAYAINQFGLEAKDAARVINTLAAGAKFGAAEIPDIAESLKISGTTAAQAGVEIESVVGALEILSQNALKGAEAGTQFRNILLSLQTKEIPGVDLKTLGLSNSLAALKPYLNDVAFLTKIFGRENVNAAQILIKNAEAVEEMTQKVTNTNVAYEQAEIRTTTLAHRFEKIKAKIDDIGITILNTTKNIYPTVQTIASLASLLTKFVPILDAIKYFFVRVYQSFFKFIGVIKISSLYIQTITKLKTISAFITTIYAKSIDKARNSAMKLPLGLNASNIALSIFIPLISTATFITNMFSSAIKGIGKAIYSIPVIGWILAIISTLTLLFTYLWKNSKKFNEVIGGIWNVIKTFFHFFLSLYENIFKNFIKPFYESLKSFANELYEKFKVVISYIVNFVTSTIKPIINLFTKFLNFIKAFIANLYDSIGIVLKPIINIWNKIFQKEKIKEITNIYKEGAEKAAKAFEIRKTKNKLSNILPSRDLLSQSKINNLVDSPKILKSLEIDSLPNNAESKSVKSVTLNIGKLFDNINIHTTKPLTDNIDEIKDKIITSLLQAVNSANALAE